MWQVVTDIGRADLLLGLTAASDCPMGPHISGILCASAGDGHKDLSPHVQHILNVSLSPGPLIDYPSCKLWIILGRQWWEEGQWNMSPRDTCCLELSNFTCHSAYARA